MNSDQILMYVFSLILGMLLANMLKGVCGCKVVEGQQAPPACTPDQQDICNCGLVLGGGEDCYMYTNTCRCP